MAKNFLIMQNNQPQMSLRLFFKRAGQETAGATGGFYANEIANNITKSSKKSSLNISERVEGESEKYISPEENY